MKLPNPNKTIIDNNKLIGYSLNFNHFEGQHKARVFKAALNLDLDNVAILKQALLEAVKNCDAVADKQNQYGQKYIIDFPLTHAVDTPLPKGRRILGSQRLLALIKFLPSK
ncbi:DUF6883 domain-containing protein [Aphanothece hegewaldii]|uniref:DUF6883 domain-containing protein n=1 Tax=Aphanothece hegewaldii TaxID=1521625 RepID=UPI001FEBF9E5|nr:DUF6883 domain-containing protein [Aphanothece hegewaldii]